ncbi:uncharacterized protein LOC142015066 [Carettochelys insculpta]|uniref:uncharacterized protein LOC142015066 n=1 Tax=Carettochelys insculpta TaxID=44489 RepID=UPI003EBE67A8
MASPAPGLPSALLPLPATVFLAVVAYLLLLLLLLALRQCLLARGLCAGCCWCEKGVLGGPCQCCLTCTHAPPSLVGCLDACRPQCQGWELGACPPFPRCCPPL